MTRVHRLVIAVGILMVGAMGIALARETVSAAGRPGPASVDIPLQSGNAPSTGFVPAAPKSRYKTLLKTLEMPGDQASYGDFCDFGYWSGTSYGGHDDLPPGYWVYLAPNWYIYKDATDAPAVPQPPRPWGPEQATGAPDTWPNSGDLTTAWASQTPDGQPEWLELTYDAPLRPIAVMVYETYNPGAVERITSYDADGKEVNLWSGTDPTPAGSEKGISVIQVSPPFDMTRIRVYVNSPKVAGWNEIDAVGLLDAAGTTHWATSATASSTYADVAGNLGEQPVIDLGAGELK